jgi:hypothetical protein
MLLILLVVTFLAGMYYCAKMTPSKLLIEEGLTNMANPRCPDILVQKDKKYFLYNSKVAKVPGVNPVEFDNLEDYVEFMDWQRSQGIRCPVLYLQTTYDAQGNSVYKVRPSPTDLQGGLPPALANKPMAPSISTPIPRNMDSNVIIKKMTGPNPTLLIDATRNDMPYNTNSVPAFDQTDFYQGSTTPLDQMDQEQENMLYSPNAMDTNWGGAEYTEKLVDSGYYADNEVKINV